MAVTYTQTQLDALTSAYAQGVLTVEYDGKRITYRSRAEMKEIIDEIQGKVSGNRRRRTSLASFNRC